MKLADKVVAVTGGGNGIGRQLVLQLLDRGARVAAADIRAESLEETASLATAGDDLSTHIVDVADRAAVGSFPDAVVTAHGAVDGYISNAGIIQPFVPLNDLEYDTIDRVLGVNLYGAIHMAKSFIPHLLDRPEAHIVNISSMGGFFPFPGQTIYGAAKAGVKLLSEGLYAELLETGVKVTVVMPGAVSTEISDNSGVEALVDPDVAEAQANRATSPEEAARIILDGVEKDAFHVFVGRDAQVMNLANKVAPRYATKLIRRQMKDLLPDI